MTADTHFFEIARYRKRLSLLFYGLFVAVVGFHALVLLLVVMLITKVGAGTVEGAWWVGTLLVFGLYLVFVMLVQRHKVRHGGQFLANKLGAVRLFLDHSQQETPLEAGEAVYYERFIKATRLRDFPSSYQRYYEFAEQMALASGLRLPKLYVLPTQNGINACVAGFDEHDAVLIVTQGALDKLDNEALYALIGHEFAHLLHGDAHLNLRLYVMMSGLSLFYEAAEWLEGLLLGEFHAQYHNRFGGGVRFDNRQAWVNHWQNTVHHDTYQQHQADESDAMALLVKAPVMLMLVVARLLGVFGMASMEWLKQCFNHQRELLADATSMRLTRSFGMSALLEQMQRHGTALSDVSVSAMDYFFFAEPKPHETTHWFNTHPTPEQRQASLQTYRYDEFGQKVTSHLKIQRLDECHQHALRHKPVVALAEEVEAYQVIEFEAPKDSISEDGRLVVNPDWYVGWDVSPVQSSLPSQHSYQTNPQTPSDLSFPTPQVSESCHSWLYPNRQSNPKAVPNKLSDLPWILVSRLRTPIGALMVIEATLLCRFWRLDIDGQFDFVDIFITLPDEWQENEYVQNCQEQLLSHRIKDEVLVALSQYERINDGVLIAKLITLFDKQLAGQGGQYQPSTLDTLTKYQQGLHTLLMQPLTVQPTALSQMRLNRKVDRLYQALILASLIQTMTQHGIGVSLGAMDERVQECLKDIDISWVCGTKAEQLTVVLLAFLVGVQDNSLLVAEFERVLLGVRRHSRLMGVVLDVDDKLLIQLILATHQLTVQGWAVLLLALAHDVKDTAFCQKLLETLHTSLLYDGVLAPKERDILRAFMVLFDHYDPNRPETF